MKLQGNLGEAWATPGKLQGCAELCVELGPQQAKGEGTADEGGPHSRRGGAPQQARGGPTAGEGGPHSRRRGAPQQAKGGPTAGHKRRGAPQQAKGGPTAGEGGPPQQARVTSLNPKP